MMKISSLHYLFLLIAFSLSSCSHYVPVNHYTAPGKLNSNYIPHLERIYLVLVLPEPDNSEEDALGSIVGSIVSSLAKKHSWFSGGSDNKWESCVWVPSGKGIERLTEKIINKMKTPISRVVAYQASYSTAQSATFKEFSHTSSLWIHIPRFHFKQTMGKITVITSEGNKEVDEYITTGEYLVKWQFYSEPGHKLLLEGSYPDGTVVIRKGKSKVDNLIKYIKRNKAGIVSKFLKDLHIELFPKYFTKNRKILKGKGELGIAYDYVKRNEWEQARKIWDKISESDPQNWMPFYHLGIYYERRSEWEAARRKYNLASGLAKRLDHKLLLSRILRQFKKTFINPPSNVKSQINSEDAKISTVRLAVLPFANATLDLFAHEYIRLEVLHHTDRGAIYASDEYRAKLSSNRMSSSMSRKGDCYDNAVAESFFSTLKNELVSGDTFESRDRARAEIFEYIEIFYNRQRIHRSLNYLTPEKMEMSVVP